MKAGEKVIQYKYFGGWGKEEGEYQLLCLDNSSSHEVTEFGKMFLFWTAQPQVSSELNTKK